MDADLVAPPNPQPVQEASHLSRSLNYILKIHREDSVQPGERDPMPGLGWTSEDVVEDHGVPARRVAILRTVSTSGSWSRVMETPNFLRTPVRMRAAAIESPPN